MDENKKQPVSVKIANAYPTIRSEPGKGQVPFIEIWQERDPHRQGQFLVTEVVHRVASRFERARSREDAVALARDWGYGDLVESADLKHYSGTTTLVVTAAILVPQDTRSIDARDLRVELRQQLPGDSERVVGHGTATVYDRGDGSHAPISDDHRRWIHGDELLAALADLPREQRAWVVAVLACGDVGVSVASFSRVI